MRGFLVLVLALAGLVFLTSPDALESGRFDNDGMTATAVTRGERLAKRTVDSLTESYTDRGAPAVAGNLSAPSTARGPEVTTPAEAEEFAGLPALNEPPPTLYTTTTTAAPSSDAERRGYAALELIGYDWQTELPGWTIIFSPGRSGVLGYTYVDTQTIEIFVRGNQSEGLLAHVIAHELGHAVDVTKNNGDERRQWQQARSITSADWWPGNGANDFSTGAGDFAESFAAWVVGPAHFRSNLAGPPNSSQLDLMAELATN